MRVLILGSEGFIGSHLVRFFLLQQYQVTGCDQIEPGGRGYEYLKVSLLSADVEDLFANRSYDVCINAAGSGNVSYSVAHPLSDFEANAASVMHILEAIRKHNPQLAYIHISSAAVYGNPEKLPVAEMQTCRPISPYGFHKLISELVSKEYSSIFNLNVAILRPFSVYGAGQKKQLLWDICSKLQTSDTITLFGTGAESRDFIHVEDMARLIHSIILSGRFDGEVFNAASGQETTIREIADIFLQHYSNKTILFSGEVRKGDPLNWRADISCISKLDYAPAISLKEGISQYVNWFRQNY